MPRYKVTIEYDGTPFAGWQIQPGQPSVQSSLIKAIERFCGETVVVEGAGRTDSGVHALGQVAHFDLTKTWSLEVVRDAINYHLKPDPIAILAADYAKEDFHARFSARERHYIYKLIQRRAPLALDRGKIWRVPVILDIEAMSRAATFLIGKHDFTTFRAASCQAKSPVKTLNRLDIQSSGDSEIHFHVAARSFMHHQVRSMVGVLKLVGERKWVPEKVKEALAAQDRQACGCVAPACGLYFYKVDYIETD